MREERLFLISALGQLPIELRASARLKSGGRELVFNKSNKRGR